MLSPARYLKDFIYLFYPDVCGACGNSLVEGEKFICLHCEYDLPKTNFHLHHDNDIEQHLAGRVLIERAAAYYFFTSESRIQQVIHNIKYRSNKELAVFIGKQYGMELKETGFLDGIDMIIPVPLHSSKLKKRGFNQSELFATGLYSATQIPVNTKVLKRLIANPTQTKKSRIARWENVESIFEVDDKELLANKHVLLVDDVITTGATLEACAMQVLKCENAKVSIATIAVA